MSQKKSNWYYACNIIIGFLLIVVGFLLGGLLNNLLGIESVFLRGWSTSIGLVPLFWFMNKHTGTNANRAKWSWTKTIGLLVGLWILAAIADLAFEPEWAKLIALAIAAYLMTRIVPASWLPPVAE